ncbi:hypothetical protein MLD38_036926 [Melastoma candidum]|uniref:Uncharacterized protein n=1 Tax=Melastoma candidum TaxID=119954 RepID=A0ACB9LL58_9MYRT|nr:hypothetical protein MLD38_036926 [Melastoma candidum]
MAAVPPSSSMPGKKKSSNTWIIVAASSASAILVVVLLAFLIAKRRKGHALIRLQDDDADEINMVESLQFNLITEATDNFSDAKKHGEGGFGSVYHGKLPNGQEIAVKQLSKNSRQGELEFKNEVVLLTRLQHRNLVRLLGFCLEGDERLLVYEFIPNSSLDQFIFSMFLP